MSVPSSKSILMILNADLVIERSTVCLGKPCISISTGKVMRLSTSEGDKPGALMMICTCGDEISGNASMGSVLNDHTPPTVKAVARIKSIRR